MAGESKTTTPTRPARAVNSAATTPPPLPPHPTRGPGQAGWRMAAWGMWKG